eukprot:6105502-Prymnesium_polylepis.1
MAVPRLKVVRLGVLLPMFDTKTGGFRPFEWAPRVGVYQAVRELNNKTDGVADHLLPDTRFDLFFQDSKCDASHAVFGALHLLREQSSGGAGADVIVGAGCSSPSISASLMAAGYTVPLVCPVSQSPVLSDGRAYPYFLRTIPSIAFAIDAGLDVLVELLQYTSIAFVASDEYFGLLGGSSFVSLAADKGLTIGMLATFRSHTTDFSEPLRALQRSGARIILLVCLPTDGSRFVRGALEIGVGGAGYLWFGDDTSHVYMPYWAGDSALLERALKGFFAFEPTNGKGSAAHTAYMARRQQLPLLGGDGKCSYEKDSSGSVL